MGFEAGRYDTIVIGAGHAGCEAALAAARMGCRTLALTVNLEAVALMACNPSLGGPAKGHLVKEIDALGGEMGLAADETMLQMRLLNTARGPAVQALRAQVDKRRYQERMRLVLERQDGLDLREGLVKELLVENGRICGVKTETDLLFMAPAVIVTTGTFLGGRILLGEFSYPGGPQGLRPAEGLTRSLKQCGFRSRRFNTTTPPRIANRNIKFDKMERQAGDDRPQQQFSFLADSAKKAKNYPCWLTHTGPKAHQVIAQHISRSPVWREKLQGTGPRYCPSIEDKIVRFPQRLSHQVFLEPEGEELTEYYVQGLYTALPEEVQQVLLRSLEGLEECRITRPGYAIEYDCIDPLQLFPALESKGVAGLYFAGQVNSTSGYEEAAAQGLLAGINAALKKRGEDPLVLDRSQAYIGVLVDDLVTKGTDEPYRMHTSRAEYRLLLRQENADERLTELGYRLGLIGRERYERFCKKWDAVRAEVERLQNTRVTPAPEVLQALERMGTPALKSPASLAQLLKRPEVNLERMREGGLDRETADLDPAVLREVENRIKYEGYINKQREQIERYRKMEEQRIPEVFDYGAIGGLAAEARDKLEQVRPRSLGQAARISGVTPADISILMLHLEERRRRKRSAARRDDAREA